MDINLARVFELYRYFPPSIATRMTVHEAIRVLLNPYCRPSYAQTGEDRILGSYLTIANPGYYVDVGCHHPIKGSNTLGLYSRGWRGLAVDGNCEYIKLFRRCRPRDISVCAVVSNQPGPISFTVAKLPELSTVSREFERMRIGDTGVRARVKTDAVRLQTLLEEHECPSQFDLLSIDCEGHDLEVLQSFSFSLFRPKIIVIEMHGFRPDRCVENQTYYYLVKHGYNMKSYSVINGIFIDESVEYMK